MKKWHKYTRGWTGLFCAILFFITLQQPCWGNDSAPYVTEGDCDGFPKIHLKTAPGLCVGLVAHHLGFARGVTVMGSDIYVTDFGGWGSRERGRLLRLGSHGHDKPEVLLDKLNEPHTVLPAPGNALYVSELGRIIRYDLATRQIKEIVINLPVDGWHPVPAFIIAPDGSLFINVGSASDNCEKADRSPPDPAAPCPETVSRTLPRAAILHVMPQAEAVDARMLLPYATGLRNSMALAVLPSGQLYAAVNSRDTIDQADPSLSDEELPHDTFDKILEGHDYGWPYCYDNNIPSPEYRHYDCSRKQLPTLLLPAHAAPLGMLFYKSKFLPFNERLIIGYHGYRAKGHRIVTLALDKNGLAESEPAEIVTGWDATPDHPQGSPVSLFEAEDGSVFIVEDHNGTLLRLSRILHEKKPS